MPKDSRVRHIKSKNNPHFLPYILCIYLTKNLSNGGFCRNLVSERHFGNYEDGSKVSAEMVGRKKKHEKRDRQGMLCRPTSSKVEHH